MSITTDAPTLLALDPVAQDLLFRDARTANTFTDEPVTDEQLQAIYDLAKWAPTAMNSQPLRLVVVRSEEARERLLGYMAEGNRAKTATAPLTVILAADVDFHEHLPRVFPHAPGLKDNFSDEQARAGLAGKQAWLQAGYFILAIRAAGLAAGPMSGFDSAGVDADLLAGTTLRSFAVVNIGQPGPDAWMQRNPRLDHDEVVTTL
ncbi:MAG: malonic semialdehyde reductase [Candidatus Nanopelagicales bacterium]